MSREQLPLTTIGCEKGTFSVEPKLGEKFIIQNGEQLRIQGEKVTVKFAGVLKEYRCYLVRER